MEQIQTMTGNGDDGENRSVEDVCNERSGYGLDFDPDNDDVVEERTENPGNMSNTNIQEHYGPVNTIPESYPKTTITPNGVLTLDIPENMLVEGKEKGADRGQDLSGV
ncbi:hypothetical protein BGZ97_011200 [Linnemannia gamsii]|jgi:hypothetical protein|uniref:Uncharacterized protein n=1 Tax=Linnemannia gamsii TaxID=64522 RepID=A0A9P6R8P4_9FUNG|nr:hypothetical protein BGZ97_011200 [Linnemannia gamsii]